MSRQLLSFSSNRVRKAMKSMKSFANISVQEHGVDIFSSYRGKITKNEQNIMVQERVINPKNYELARHASEDRKNFYQGLKPRNHEMNIMKPNITASTHCPEMNFVKVVLISAAISTILSANVINAFLGYFFFIRYLL